MQNSRKISYHFISHVSHEVSCRFRTIIISFFKVTETKKVQIDSSGNPPSQWYNAFMVIWNYLYTKEYIACLIRASIRLEEKTLPAR